MAGELDLAAAPAISRMFAETAAARCGRVVVDTSGVTFIDAAGFGAVLAGPDEHDGPDDHDDKVDIVLITPSRVVRRLLELTDNSRLLHESHGDDPVLGEPELDASHFDMSPLQHRPNPSSDSFDDVASRTLGG